jgi:DNA-binding transcriptional regulator YiaG
MAIVNVKVTLPDEDAVRKFISAMREMKAEIETDDEEDEVISWEEARQTVFSGKTREQIAGGALRAAREKAGLTQAQLGNLVGLSKHNISKMEH